MTCVLWCYVVLSSCPTDLCDRKLQGVLDLTKALMHVKAVTKGKCVDCAHLYTHVRAHTQTCTCTHIFYIHMYIQCAVCSYFSKCKWLPPLQAVGRTGQHPVVTPVREHQEGRPPG